MVQRRVDTWQKEIEGSETGKCWTSLAGHHPHRRRNAIAPTLHLAATCIIIKGRRHGLHLNQNAGKSLETSEFSCTCRSSPFLLISWTLALQTSAWARKSIWRSCYGGRHVHQNGQQTGSFVGCRLGRSSLCAKCMSIAWQVELTNRSIGLVPFETQLVWIPRLGKHLEVQWVPQFKL